MKVYQREDLSSVPVCQSMIPPHKKVLQHSDDLNDDSHSDKQFISWCNRWHGNSCMYQLV